MLVLSRALILAPVESEPLETPILGWHNIVTPSNLEADTELDDYPDVNLTNPATNHIWKAADTSTQYVTVTIGTVLTTDYVGIARHNLGTGQITVSVEALIEEVWTEIIAEFIPADDSPLLLRYVPTSAAGIRIKLQPGATAPQASVIYVGKLVVFELGLVPPFTPLSHGLKRSVTNGQSESGNFTGRIQTGGRRESTPTFNNLSASWYRENLADIIEANGNEPFFFSWHPSGYPRETGYGWVRDGNDPTPEFLAAGFVNLTIPMAGIIS